MYSILVISVYVSMYMKRWGKAEDISESGVDLKKHVKGLFQSCKKGHRDRISL